MPGRGADWSTVKASRSQAFLPCPYFWKRKRMSRSKCKKTKKGKTERNKKKGKERREEKTCMLSGRRWVSFFFLTSHTPRTEKNGKNRVGEESGASNKYPEKYFVAGEGQRGGKDIPILHGGYATRLHTCIYYTRYDTSIIRTIQQYVPNTPYVYVCVFF